MEPQIEYISSFNNFENCFVQFQKSLCFYKQNVSGKFIFKTLEYQPSIIDHENCKNKLSRIFTRDQSSYTRSFLVYVPEQLKEKAELIVLLHGTDETIFDTELLFQTRVPSSDNETKEQKSGHEIENKVMGWVHYADLEKCIIILPQSRGIVYGKKNHYGWQPGNQDLNYLFKILETFGSSKELSNINICPHNITLVGFSNGGMLVSDLYLEYTSFAKPKHFSISLFVSYMGGLETSIKSRETIQLNKDTKKTPLLLISCKRDENYGPCLRAEIFFKAHECNVNFVEIEHMRHEFIGCGVDMIGEWIRKSKRMNE